MYSLVVRVFISLSQKMTQKENVLPLWARIPQIIQLKNSDRETKKTTGRIQFPCSLAHFPVETSFQTKQISFIRTKKIMCDQFQEWQNHSGVSRKTPKKNLQRINKGRNDCDVMDQSHDSLTMCLVCGIKREVVVVLIKTVWRLY